MAHVDARISIVGLFMGFLIGLTGIGGGALLSPILIVFFGIPPTWTVATDILYSSVTKGVGSLLHMRHGQVNVRVALRFACGSVPAILLSVLLVHYVQKHYGAMVNGLIIHALGMTLVLLACLILGKPYLMARLERKKQGKERREVGGVAEKGWRARRKVRVRIVATVLVGAVVGFLVGLTSVGSGTLIVVSMAFLYPKLTPKELVGTDIFQAFLLLLAGSIGYLNSGVINWTLVALLLCGSLPGVFLGSQASKIIPQRFLAPILAVTLAISGLKLL